MVRKQIIILSAVLFLAAVSSAQDTLTISQIRMNPQFGQTVITGGVVTAGPDIFRRYELLAGRFFMGDPEGGPYSGITAYSGPYDLQKGDSIIFTATVRDFNGMTVLAITPGTMQNRGTAPVPDPVVVPASIIDTLGIPDSIFQQYQSVLIRINDVTFDRTANAYDWIWFCHTSEANFRARIQSDSIPDFFTPVEGTEFGYINGVVDKTDYEPYGVFLWARYLTDLGAPSGPPLISRVERFPRLPASGDPVAAKAIILDDGTIAQASLFYRIEQGTWIEVAAIDSVSSVYSAVIPAQPDSTHVDYYYRAQDNDGNISFEPSGAPDSFYSYVVGWRQLCHYVPGDINASGEFNGMDVVFAVNYFTGSPGPPPYPCDCVDRTPFFPAGDANGTCSFNGLDVTYMVFYFKGGPPIRYCQDCPPAP